MALAQELQDAFILGTQIKNDFKNGVAQGATEEANQVGSVGFFAAVAELTRLCIKALKKYVGEE